ncbi:uncharacterized protein THITE_2107760 [Thermothielavioides terrestris NRRL 8126]|uniref:Uncharacterized protein n=1 Tax=Thermothielavioides terrestris (strain ATCC 38088 / NRRL 8126) TaxID=578455 RepID=G2QV60_THETT|nr:uncharacterized protein THITE_2107760 [Thermothielavioides terrestris NRRL 8126]AEO62947.1 hypothetical protein THITE_2107760 [Thermothielavioides terrestris NRRL 8126]
MAKAPEGGFLRKACASIMCSFVSACSMVGRKVGGPGISQRTSSSIPISRVLTVSVVNWRFQ